MPATYLPAEGTTYQGSWSESPHLRILNGTRLSPNLKDPSAAVGRGTEIADLALRV